MMNFGKWRLDLLNSYYRNWIRWNRKTSSSWNYYWTYLSFPRAPFCMQNFWRLWSKGANSKCCDRKTWNLKFLNRWVSWLCSTWMRWNFWQVERWRLCVLCLENSQINRKSRCTWNSRCWSRMHHEKCSELMKSRQCYSCHHSIQWIQVSDRGYQRVTFKYSFNYWQIKHSASFKIVQETRSSKCKVFNWVRDALNMKVPLRSFIRDNDTKMKHKPYDFKFEDRDLWVKVQTHFSANTYFGSWK